MKFFLSLFAAALVSFHVSEAQNACECTLIEPYNWTSFFLDTCGITGDGPACEDKWSYNFYSSVDSFYARVQSTVGWSIVTPSDWFSHIRPMDTWPAEMGRDTFDFSQFNRTAYPAVYDSISLILQEFGVEARILIKAGPYAGNPNQKFLYYFFLNKKVNALAFLNRLKNWVAADTALDQYVAEYTGALIKETLVSVQDLNPGSLECFYRDQQLFVRHTETQSLDVVIVNSLGSRILTVLAEPGQTAVSVADLPAGIYFVTAGQRCEKFVKWE